MAGSDIKIYQIEDGKAEISVRLDKETVWLNLTQMVELFERDKSVISRHINSVFKEGELDRSSVVAKNATTAADGKTYQVEYYNLDVIISVGYRVNSKRGTQFRIWANHIIKEYLVKGYSLNSKLLEHKSLQLKALQETIKVLGNTANRKELTSDESIGLLKIISDYAYALDILDQYDYQTLDISETTQREAYRLTYKEAKAQIEIAKNAQEVSELFGQEKDHSFHSSINTIYQTFNGIDLYPSIEEKGANLLYLITKNHSFTDGNKRIAAFLFLYFLEKNGVLFDEAGKKRIADNALVALTLMIAVSKPEEKGIITKVVVNLINKNNNVA
jgi:prophage maintenance system killer protein